MKTEKTTTVKDLEIKSKQIKQLILEISHRAQIGHIGSALSIADIVSVLYFGILKLNPKNPKWKQRDRFVLSKGHAVAALYSALYLKGYISKEILFSYCQNKGLLGEHPDHHVPGVELSTGSLGHGLSVGVGFALATKLRKERDKTYVILSDGECNEGEIWEAALFAAHNKLANLTVAIDYNKVQAFGTVKNTLNLEPLADKWKSFGWNIFEVDGHNITQLLHTFKKNPHTSQKPTAIICHTVRGKGVSFMENHIEWHYFTTSVKQQEQALKELNR